MPHKCLDNAGACLVEAADVVSVATADVPALTRPVSSLRSEPKVAVAPKATPVAPGVIAGTFDMLQNPQTEIRQAAKQAAGVAALQAPVTERPAQPAVLGSKPTTRVVQATVVRAGTPVVPAPAPQIATQPPTNLVALADPAVDPKAWVDAKPQPEAVEVAALVTPEDMPIPAPLDQRPPSPGSLDHLAITVGDSAINVRSAPDQGSSRLFGLDASTTVDAIGVAGNWLQIKDAQGRTGWVFTENLLPPDPKAMAALPKVDAPAADAKAAVANTGGGNVRFVGGKGVNVRASATRGAQSLFTLKAGEKVTVTGNQRGWLKITDDQGRSGWVYKDFVSARG